jgi:hypothetical protein
MYKLGEKCSKAFQEKGSARIAEAYRSQTGRHVVGSEERPVWMEHRHEMRPLDQGWRSRQGPDLERQ